MPYPKTACLPLKKKWISARGKERRETRVGWAGGTFRKSIREGRTAAASFRKTPNFRGEGKKGKGNDLTEIENDETISCGETRNYLLCGWRKDLVWM